METLHHPWFPSCCCEGTRLIGALPFCWAGPQKPTRPALENPGPQSAGSNPVLFTHRNGSSAPKTEESTSILIFVQKGPFNHPLVTPAIAMLAIKFLFFCSECRTLSPPPPVKTCLLFPKWPLFLQAPHRWPGESLRDAQRRSHDGLREAELCRGRAHGTEPGGQKLEPQDGVPSRGSRGHTATALGPCPVLPMARQNKELQSPVRNTTAVLERDFPEEKVKFPRKRWPGGGIHGGRVCPPHPRTWQTTAQVSERGGAREQASRWEGPTQTRDPQRAPAPRPLQDGAATAESHLSTKAFFQPGACLCAKCISTQTSLCLRASPYTCYACVQAHTYIRAHHTHTPADVGRRDQSRAEGPSVHSVSLSLHGIHS